MTEAEMILKATETDHAVVRENKTVWLPEVMRVIAVSLDHKVEYLTFDCPRYWEEDQLVDLMEYNMYINYQRADDEKNELLITQTVDADDDTIIHFTWEITEHATAVEGLLRFNVEARKVDSDGNVSNRWHTRLKRDMFIAEGLEATEVEEILTPSVVDQLRKEIKEAGGGGGVEVDTTLTKAGAAADAKVTGDKITELSEKKVTYRGDWSATEVYVVNDMVSHENVTYLSIKAGKNQNPTAEDSEYWKMLGGGGSDDDKVDRTGWNASIYLGSNADGEVVARTALEIARDVVEYLPNANGVKF